VLIFCALWAASCTAVAESDWAPRPVREVEHWSVLAGDELVGRVVLLEIGESAPARFYQVQNQQGQWLGWVDAQGRVWQRVPFEMKEQFLGVHPMAKGLALLYAEERPLQLQAAPAGVAMEAAAGR
jgi:hypothetical protein